MPDNVIKLENVSKQYRLGIIGTYSLQSDFERWWARISGKGDPFLKIGQENILNSKSNKRKNEYVWALKDINLEVKEGEVIGIIGKNGAGKSTMLKLLSRVTAPTTGKIKVKGRIASLLEVGTGFHPELTGRENIYLNGTILGMRRAEITGKFDEIVDFSGVGKYIDTPVKRYSSGMYVRLAFAVAAHLDPEILIVDEVLAVGDAEFQKKAIGKMEAISKGQGRTVLFVSHNMASIRQLCGTALCLNQGRIEFSGSVNETIDYYIKNNNLDGAEGAEKVLKTDENKEFQLLYVKLFDKFGNITQNFYCDDFIGIEAEIISRNPIPGLYGYLSINSKRGETVLISDTFDFQPNILDSLSVGNYRLVMKVPPRTLSPGDYVVYFNFGSEQSFNGFNVDSPKNVCSFHLDDITTQRGNRRGGFLSSLIKWEIEKIDR